MNKRGQVTIFIILGIVLLVVVVLLFFARDLFISGRTSPQDDSRFLSSQIEPVKAYVQDCANIISLKGIRLIAIQGGYFKPYKYQTLGAYNVSYACFRNNGVYVNILPLLSDLNLEFSNYINDPSTQKEFDSCINNFKPFTDKKLKVKENAKAKISSDIGYERVGVLVFYPLTLSKGDVSSSIDRISFDIPIGLGKAHRVASDIVNLQCSGKEFDIDSYSVENFGLATISPQYYTGNTFWYLSTITKEKELPLDFHFVIQK